MHIIAPFSVVARILRNFIHHLVLNKTEKIVKTIKPPRTFHGLALHSSCWFYLSTYVVEGHKTPVFPTIYITFFSFLAIFPLTYISTHFIFLNFQKFLLQSIYLWRSCCTNCTIMHKKTFKNICSKLLGWHHYRVQEEEKWSRALKWLSRHSKSMKNRMFEWI